MKKILVLAVSLLFIVECYTQDNYFKYNGAADVYLRYLPRGEGGKAIVHDVGNSLVFNYGNDFTGGVRIGSTLDVQGMLSSVGFYLKPSQYVNGWSTTYLQYVGHSLTIGPPKGGWAHTNINIVPGSSTKENCFSSLSLSISNTNEEFITKVTINTAGNSYFNGGNVGIGTETPKEMLDVAGTIRAREVKVEVTAGMDRVFNNDYSLKPLSEVEAFVKENKHLPEIPSEKHMQENGLNMNEFQIKLLQKIEELTLYVIDLKKENLEQNKLIEGLQERLENK